MSIKGSNIKGSEYTISTVIHRFALCKCGSGFLNLNTSNKKAFRCLFQIFISLMFKWQKHHYRRYPTIWWHVKISPFLIPTHFTFSNTHSGLTVNAAPLQTHTVTELRDHCRGSCRQSVRINTQNSPGASLASGASIIKTVRASALSDVITHSLTLILSAVERLLPKRWRQMPFQQEQLQHYSFSADKSTVHWVKTTKNKDSDKYLARHWLGFLSTDYYLDGDWFWSYPLTNRGEKRSQNVSCLYQYF